MNIPIWAVKNPHDKVVSLIVAGETIVCSASQKVTGIDMKTKKAIWTLDVEGTPYGLAVANNRLYVSTDSGMIYCFGANLSYQRKVSEVKPKDISAYGADPIFKAAADEIVKKTGITEGYCLDFGCKDGKLAFELAKRTNLKIYAVDEDAINVALARKNLDAVGLYGVRVIVHQQKLNSISYPKYFANLIVSGRSATDGLNTVPSELLRFQRPYGGVLCIGKPGTMKKEIKGELKGAGVWTHQYANPANTCSSNDTLVKGPLRIRWFGGFDLKTPNRHGRPPAPLFLNGRLFVEEIDGICAIDAYNGRFLWKFTIKDIGKPYHGEHLMGVSGTGSNYCVANNIVYVANGDECVRIEAETGKRVGEFKAPLNSDGKPGTWGYIACVDNILFGSLVNEKHLVPGCFEQGGMDKLFTESTLFFAMDVDTGKLKWSYKPQNSIRHNAIAIGGGNVYLIDRALALEERGKKIAKPHPTGEPLAFNAKTGEKIWSNTKDIYGTVLVLSVEHKVLLMCYQPCSFRLSSECGGRMSTFKTLDGTRIWGIEADYAPRLIINGNTIYATGAWDLLTGKPKPFEFKRYHGCGIISASQNLLLFRSATLGYIDLLQKRDRTLRWY